MLVFLVQPGGGGLLGWGVVSWFGIGVVLVVMPRRWGPVVCTGGMGVVWHGAL